MNVWCDQNGQNQKCETTCDSKSDRACKDGARDFNGLATMKIGIKNMLERK